MYVTFEYTMYAAALTQSQLTNALGLFICCYSLRIYWYPRTIYSATGKFKLTETSLDRAPRQSHIVI